MGAPVTSPQPRRPVGRPRQDGRPHLTRDAVLQTAGKMIARHGFAGASIRMLAGALDCSPASLFNLFPSKDALLNELMAYAAAPSLAFYRDLRRLGATAPAVLFKTVYEEVLIVTSVDEDFPALFYLPELKQPAFAAARDARAQMVSHYRELIVAGLDAGVFRCGSAALAAEQMLQLTETSILAGGEARALPCADQARATARFCLRGLLADPGRLDSIEAEALAIDLTIRLPPSALPQADGRGGPPANP